MQEVKDNYIGCPIRYRTQHFFNNFTTNEDIAMQVSVASGTHCIKRGFI